MLLRYIKDAPIVYAMIFINIIVFAIINLQPDVKNTLALWLPIHADYQHWQWLTSIFSHQGIGHLFFNMFALWSFGIAVYYRLGTAKFLVIYLTLCSGWFGIAFVLRGLSAFPKYHTVNAIWLK